MITQECEEIMVKQEDSFKSLFDCFELMHDHKIYMVRNKQYIYFHNPQKDTYIRYCLKERSLQKQHKITSKWYNVKTQYDFFYNRNINSLQSDDEKFLEMIKQSKSVNSNCSSLSTFVNRMGNILVYENFINEGVKYEIDYRYRSYGRLYNHLKHGLEEYNKNVIKFFKNTEFYVDNNFEHWYFKDKDFAIKIINMISYFDLSKSKKRKLVGRIVKNDAFDTLIKEYKYDFKALLNYCVNYLKPFENIDFNSVIRLLRDYYQMASTIGRHVKKYPKYLRSMHDIITANYNSYKREYDEPLFKKLMKPELEYEDKNFCIVIPVCSKDVICEGTDLNHCVSSYVEKILDQKTYIFFLRESDDKEESLVTLELIGGEITQAKGSYNRKITVKEKAFLQKYCKIKKIKLGDNL